MSIFWLTPAKAAEARRTASDRWRDSTGSGTSTCLAAAKKFVEEGAYVFVTGRRQAELDKAKTIIGKNVSTVQGDVANAGFVEIAATEVATPEHLTRRSASTLCDLLISWKKLVQNMNGLDWRNVQ